MDKLKDFINRNREAFDNVDLPKGHLERFRQKLGAPRPTIRHILLPIAASVAAACIIAILLIPEWMTKKDNPSPGALFICEADEEMDSLHEYYNMRVYDLGEQIKSRYESHPTDGALHLVEESQKVTLAVRQFEEELLPELPCTDNGLFVIKQQYDGAIESLSFMVEQLDNISREE